MTIQHTPVNAKVALPTVKGLIFFPISDLLYFEVSEKDLVLYHWEKDMQKTKTVIYKGITSLKPKLEPYGFLMVRRNILINTFQIKSFHSDKTIIMTDGRQIHPSRANQAALKVYIQENFGV